MGKHLIILAFFLLSITSFTYGQSLDFSQSTGSIGTVHKTETINVGGKDYVVNTDRESEYSLTNRYNGKNGVIVWWVNNRTSSSYLFKIIDYSPLITSSTNYFTIRPNKLTSIDDYSYNLNNLPSYRPCTSGTVVGKFLANGSNTVTLKEIKVKWGPAYRKIKWGDFNNLQGKYLDYVSIVNNDSYIPYYGAKTHYVSKSTSIRNSKFISKEIIVKASYNFLGVKSDGTWGSIPYDPNQHVIIGANSPIILYPGTILKAVDEDYFDTPSSSITQLKGSEINIVQKEILIYPNPNNGRLLYIKHNENILLHKIEIYDGVKVVHNWSNKNIKVISKKSKGEYITINISLKKGLYNCKIYTDTGIYNKKLFIQ